LYAFDAPSHGFSSKGETSLFEFTDLVKELILRYGVRDLLSHSFGGVATTYALSQLPSVEIDRYLLLTTPDRFTERIDDVAQAVGISQRVKDLLKNRLAEETGYDLATLNVSDFVKQIKVRQALIIHDEADKVIPIMRSLNVANNWPAAEFETVRGTGHFRILRDASVIEKVVAFFAE
ncbi:MAG: alpha/beta hydrolase, partial [Bacteroidota bacterium]